MADEKISQLTDGGLIQAGDELPINRAGANYRISGSNLIGATGATGPSGPTGPRGATGAIAAANLLDFVTKDLSPTGFSNIPTSDTLWITGNAVTYDGSTEICIEFQFLPEPDFGQSILAHLYEDGVKLGTIVDSSTPTTTTHRNAWTATGKWFRTPTAGSHTYSIYLQAQGGTTNNVWSGANSVGGDTDPYYALSFMRITRSDAAGPKGATGATGAAGSPGGATGATGPVGATGAGGGAEVGYAQITSNVNILSTTEASGTTIISPGALTFDGSPVIVEFYAIAITVDSGAPGDIVIVNLFEGSTQITRLGWVQTNITSSTTSEGMYARYRFTPTAGSHTYTITAYASSTTGTPKVFAGAGGTGGYPPAFVRFSKA